MNKETLFQKIKQGLAFVLRNWYAAGLTVISFLIGIEVLGTWAGYGFPFLCLSGIVIKKITS